MSVDQAGHPDTIHTSLASCRPSEAHSATRRQALPCCSPHIGHRHGGERWPACCGCFFVPVSPRPTFSSNQHGQSVTNPASPNHIKPGQARPDRACLCLRPRQVERNSCTLHATSRLLLPLPLPLLVLLLCPSPVRHDVYHERQSGFHFPLPAGGSCSMLLGPHALRPALLLPPASAPHHTTHQTRPDQTRPRDSNITPH